jgi:uncharacterized membrane protein YfcA
MGNCPPLTFACGIDQTAQSDGGEMELAGDVMVWLVLAALVAGFVDAIAGGGGLITVPALMLAGLPTVHVLATNKLQGSFGAGAAAIAYARAGHVNLRRQWPMALVAAGAAALGALAASHVPDQFLRMVMPVLLLAIAAYFAFKPGLDDRARARRVGPLAFGALFVPVIAAYDGFLGPGTGSFLMLGFVLLAGQGMLAATAQTKLLNFASNIGSLAVFVLSGAVLWKVGLAMALGQTAGALIGARVAMWRGAEVIKPLLIAISTALALRLIWQNWL